MTTPAQPLVVGVRGKKLIAVCQRAACGKTFEFYARQKLGDVCSAECRRYYGRSSSAYVGNS